MLARDVFITYPRMTDTGRCNLRTVILDYSCGREDGVCVPGDDILESLKNMNLLATCFGFAELEAIRTTVDVETFREFSQDGNGGTRLIYGFGDIRRRDGQDIVLYVFLRQKDKEGKKRSWFSGPAPEEIAMDWRPLKWHWRPIDVVARYP